MQITTDSPELLVLRFTRWKAPLAYAILTLIYLAAAALLVRFADVPTWALLAWLAATVSWSLPLALFRVEKSMLVLNATSGEAELRRRDIRGLHVHHWPLDEVQSTRITRGNLRGSKRRPASDDPRRVITLFVREGMDEGRHRLTHYPVNADDALAASARVSDWMKDWRRSLDSHAPQA